jgi:hypothetical protein
MKTFGLGGIVEVDVEVKRVRRRIYIEKMGVILVIGMDSKHFANTGNASTERDDTIFKCLKYSSSNITSTRHGKRRTPSPLQETMNLA